MVKPVQKAEINNFVQGLVTEASPLNFPPNASKEEENFELNRDGSRQRRFGIGFETDYVARSTGYNIAGISSAAVSSFKWVGAGRNPLNEFAVVQIGNHVDIYNLGVDSLSGDGFLGSVTLTGVIGNQPFSYSDIEGFLVVSAGTDTIHIIEYDAGAFLYTQERLLTRDLWGVYDGFENNAGTARPTALSDEHLYNLRNQGWSIPRKAKDGIQKDPITLFRDYMEGFAYIFDGVDYVYDPVYDKGYPSNTDSVYTAIEFTPSIYVGGFTDPFEAVVPALWEDRSGLAVQAAKGYFIIDVLRRGSSRIQANSNNLIQYPELTFDFTTLPEDTTSGGVSLTQDFAGRIFYAGFTGEVTGADERSPNLSSYVFFSQVVKNRTDFSKCYSEGDPTSREGSDIVDTDGGFFRVSGAKKIVGMRVQGGSLFIIADNGVWRVVGGSDYGFTATNYKVDKISNFGGLSESSIVEVNDQIYYWGEEGIFQIAKNQYGDWTVSNISEKLVQKGYNGLLANDKKGVVGIYESSSKKIRWLVGFNKLRNDTSDVREVVFDLLLGAFSLNTIKKIANSPEAVGYVTVPPYNLITNQEGVVVEGDPVVANADPVTVDELVRLYKPSSIKLITLHSVDGFGNVGYTFSQYKNPKFLDWEEADGVGVDAKAYLLTGTLTAGDSSIYKQTPYLVMHFLKTESGVELVGDELVPSGRSSCFIRSQWDWANSANSGKWSDLFQAYRYKKPIFIVDANDPYDNGFETVVTKNKLRGRGRALSIYMETEPERDCIILGWSLSMTGNRLA